MIFPFLTKHAEMEQIQPLALPLQDFTLRAFHGKAQFFGYAHHTRVNDQVSSPMR